MEAQSKQRWTYAEFGRLPGEGSTRYGVIVGELVVTPSPSRRHQRVSIDLATRLQPVEDAAALEIAVGEVVTGER